MQSDLIGISQSIKRVRTLIERVAKSGMNIVVCGESGVGKEVVVQSLYHLSPRRAKPFVKINCAAIPGGLIESELFGYEAGAFTGANCKKRGKIELACGGVLFLDEIGDMSPALQAKLLHVCQSGEYAPLGSENSQKTDAWIMAATNKNLSREVKQERFRKDLYYRLNIVNIYLPPLRKRPEDIPPLIDYYMAKYATRYRFKSISKPSDTALKKLQRYHWPGNVRELQNVLKHSMALDNWENVIEVHLPRVDINRAPSSVEPVATESFNVPDFLGIKNQDSPELAAFGLKRIRKKAADRIEHEVISYILARTNWNRTKAVKILDISYKTLLTKIRELNITPPPSRV